jgi:NADH-quinone oxidoreductase subunit A
MGLQAYLPVLMLMGFVLMNAAIIIGLSQWAMRRRPSVAKSEAYESGIPVLGDARERFSVKFYLIAMLFIVFDIETIFLIPWGTAFRRLSCSDVLVDGVCTGATSFFGLGEMLVFMAILAVGLAYVWRKGALQWD